MRRAVAATALAATAFVVGCARDESPTVPAACKEGRESLRRALAGAPGPVSLGGTTLSDCLVRAREPVDAARVGGGYVGVASDLGDRMRARPQGREALELGYLVGAVRRGAVASQGIHDELLRRVRQELVGLDTSSPTFRRGERAGRAHG